MSMYLGSQANGNHACRHLCVLFTCMCQFLCVCVCVYVCWLQNKESRKRKRLDGWRGCLFIHHPAALAVSRGHGNTCPGPFSAVLFVACFGPAKAFSSHLLCSLLNSVCTTFLFFRSLGFHFCLSYNVLCSCFCAATSLSLGIWILFCCAAFNVLMMSSTGPDWQVLNLRARQLS